jgi:hypothetical protein
VIQDKSFPDVRWLIKTHLLFQQKAHPPDLLGPWVRGEGQLKLKRLIL